MDTDNDYMPSHRLLASSLDWELTWGFTFDPPPVCRMHVRCFNLDGTPTIWLEGTGGVRAWEPASGCPPDVAAASRADLEIQRPEIERYWLRHMIADWAYLSMTVQLPHITLMAYPGTDRSFSRRFHLQRGLGILRPPAQADAYSLVAEPDPALLVGGAGIPERWRTRIPITPDMLWK